MKKSIAAFVFGFFVVGVLNATTVNWGSTFALNAGNGFANGDVAVLVWDSAGDGLAALTGSDMTSGFAVHAGGNDQVVAVGTANGSLNVVQATLINPGYNGTAGYGTAVSAWSAGVKNNLYLVVFNSATINGGVTYYAYAGQGSPNIQNNSNNAFDSAGSDYTYVSVPEPASFVLMGLGVGVMALRRRFDKKA